MKKIWFYLFSIICFSHSYAQTDLVYLNDLSYHSTFEEWAVQNHFTKKTISPFLLYCAVDSSCTNSAAKNYEKNFYKYLSDIELEVNRLNKPKQKTNYVFNSIHKRFLKKYKYNVRFSELFTTGEFNCLTATCLYALAFEKFKIPYEIVIAPGHSYLMAYPNENDFVVETTNPVNGVYTLDEKKFIKYKQRLLDYKLITEQEFEILTIKDFQHHQDSTVNNYSLVSYLYSNKLAECQIENQKQQFELAQKIYIFNPIERNFEILNDKSVRYCWLTRYDINQYKTILMYARSRDSSINHNAKTHNKIIASKIYDKDLSFTDYKKLYLKLKTQWSDTLPVPFDSISESYYRQEAIHYETKRMFKEAKESCLNLYNISRDSTHISWFVYNLNNYFELEWNFAANLYDLKAYTKEYPAFMSNYDFKKLYYFTLINSAAFYINLRDSEKALPLRNEFESNYLNNIPELRENIAQVYIIFASYYFRYGKTKEAKTAINKGLYYSPNDLRLMKLKFSLE